MAATGAAVNRDRSANCQRREVGAGEGNRTLVVSLEGFCSTIELHPRAVAFATAAAPRSIVAIAHSFRL